MDSIPHNNKKHKVMINKDFDQLDEIKLTEDKKKDEEVSQEQPEQIPHVNLDEVMQQELDQLKVHPDMKKKPFNWVPIALKIRQLLIVLTKLFFNNTDVICFFAMLVNVLYAPT